jgi:hypothetical protein
VCSEWREELQDGRVCIAFSTNKCSLDSSLNLCAFEVV